MKDIYEALSFMIDEDEPVNIIVRALDNAFFITHDEAYINDMNNELMFDEISSECMYYLKCKHHLSLIENIVKLLKNGTLIKDIHIRDVKEQQVVIHPTTITTDELEEYNYFLYLFNQNKNEDNLKHAMEVIYYKDPISCNILKAYLNSFNNVFNYLISINKETKCLDMIKRFLFYVQRDNNHELTDDDYKKYLVNLLKITKNTSLYNETIEVFENLLNENEINNLIKNI